MLFACLQIRPCLFIYLFIFKVWYDHLFQYLNPNTETLLLNKQNISSFAGKSNILPAKAEEWRWYCLLALFWLQRSNTPRLQRVEETKKKKEKKNRIQCETHCLPDADKASWGLWQPLGDKKLPTVSLAAALKHFCWFHHRWGGGPTDN